MTALLPIAKQLTQPGEHAFFYEGRVGKIESLLTVPPIMNNNYVALLGHPHSLQGGTMHNKVVTTMVRAFKELNIASIRCNFRGVGASAGHFDHGIGESDDLLILAEGCRGLLPNACPIFAGFSFGSYVAYRAAAQNQHAMLITVAPPIHHFNYLEYTPAPTPWIVIQGDEDDIVPLSFVLDFVAKAPYPVTLLQFDETGHFFHGKLTELKSRLIEVIKVQLMVNL